MYVKSAELQPAPLAEGAAELATEDILWELELSDSED